MNNHYNKKLKSFANEMRNDSTLAEIKLWSDLLRAKKLMGYSFLRQRPIGNYIADFLCKDLKLIIEVDGVSHDFKSEEDALRDKNLNRLGFTVIRFSDEEVMNDMNYVEDTLKNWINSKVKS